MEELARRREEAYNAGGKAKLEARRQKGLMTARDRIEALFDAGSFMEFGMHVQHNCHNFGMEKKVLPTDGIVCGIGTVNGRQVAAFSQDFTVAGGSLGSNHAKNMRPHEVRRRKRHARNRRQRLGRRAHSGGR